MADWGELEVRRPACWDETSRESPWFCHTCSCENVMHDSYGTLIISTGIIWRHLAHSPLPTSPPHASWTSPSNREPQQSPHSRLSAYSVVHTTHSLSNSINARGWKRAVMRAWGVQISYTGLSSVLRLVDVRPLARARDVVGRDDAAGSSLGRLGRQGTGFGFGCPKTPWQTPEYAGCARIRPPKLAAMKGHHTGLSCQKNGLLGFASGAPTSCTAGYAATQGV